MVWVQGPHFDAKANPRSYWIEDENRTLTKKKNGFYLLTGAPDIKYCIRWSIIYRRKQVWDGAVIRGKILGRGLYTTREPVMFPKMQSTTCLAHVLSQSGAGKHKSTICRRICFQLFRMQLTRSITFKSALRGQINVIALKMGENNHCFF